MSTILFFDDYALTRCDGLQRKICHPKLENTYSDPDGVIGTTCVHVVYDSREKVYRMYSRMYPHGAVHGTLSCAVVSVSRDGVHFERENTEDISVEGRLFSNQILPQEQAHELCQVLIDETAPDDERYKALVFVRSQDGNPKSMHNDVWVSGDGRAFRKMEGAHWHPLGTEPGMFAFYNPVYGEHTFILRPVLGERRIAVSSSRDFINYAPLELDMQADALDPPLSEIYGMPVIPYEGQFVAFPWIYRVDQREENAKFWQGHIETQLAYSVNGRHFQRTLRDPFILPGEPGDITYGLNMITGGCVQPDGSLLLYAQCSRKEHRPIRQTGQSFAAIFSLRRDGFVCLESEAGPALLRTRPLLIRGEISLNLNCYEPATVALLNQDSQPIPGFAHEDCIPFEGDSTEWTPVFRERCLRELYGKVAALELRFASGKVYAIRGEITPLYSNWEANYARKTGCAMERRGV